MSFDLFFSSAGETKKELKKEVSKMTDELSSKMESAKLEDKVRTNKDLVAIEAFTHLTIYIIRVTLNTEFDTLWLSPVNFQSAGSILTNDT